MIKKFIRFFLPPAQINVAGVHSNDIESFTLESNEIPVKRQRSQEKTSQGRKKFEISDTDQDSFALLDALNSKADKASDNEAKVSVEEDFLHNQVEKGNFSNFSQAEIIEKYARDSQSNDDILDIINLSDAIGPIEKKNKSIKGGTKFWTIPEGIFAELPSTKQKLKFLEINSNDDLEAKFEKLYRSKNLGRIYSDSKELFQGEQTENSSRRPQVNTSKELRENNQSLEFESKSASDIQSFLTDSFVTPEDSPLLNPSPESSRITPFQLESPINQLKSELPQVNFNKENPKSLTASPFFPNMPESNFEVKSSILFSNDGESKQPSQFPSTANKAPQLSAFALSSPFSPSSPLSSSIPLSPLTHLTSSSTVHPFAALSSSRQITPFDEISQSGPELKTESAGQSENETVAMIISRENSIFESKENDEKKEAKPSPTFHPGIMFGSSRTGNPENVFKTGTSGNSNIFGSGASNLGEGNAGNTSLGSSLIQNNEFKQAGTSGMFGAAQNSFNNPFSTQGANATTQGISQSGNGANPFLDTQGKLGLGGFGQVSPPESILNKGSSNPFLNVGHATISTPKYQFGQGMAMPAPAASIGSNPFLVNSSK